MAGIIGAAVAFAIAGVAVNYGYGMKEIQGSDYKRHNLGMEKIAKNRERFNEERILSIDAHNKRLSHENESAQDSRETKNELAHYGNNIMLGMPTQPESSMQELSTVLAITASLVIIYIFMK